MIYAVNLELGDLVDGAQLPDSVRSLEPLVNAVLSTLGARLPLDAKNIHHIEEHVFWDVYHRPLSQFKTILKISMPSQKIAVTSHSR